MNKERLKKLTDDLKLADEIMTKLGIEASDAYIAGLSPILSNLSYDNIVEAGEVLRAELENWRTEQPRFPYPWFRLVNHLDLGSSKDPDVMVTLS